MVAWRAVRFWRVEEPVTNKLVVVAPPVSERFTPEMRPVLVMEKRVEVANAAVEDDIWNKVVFISPPTTATESLANGEVVPIPTFPPINVATAGLTCVVEAINAAIVPREKIPEMPTSSPPPA